jgi:hypothetical protein
MGYAVTNHVWVVTNVALLDAAATQILFEQEYLAGRAHREGRLLDAAVHRINVADAQAEVGFRWLQRIRSESYWSRSKVPWTSYAAARDLTDYRRDPKYQGGRDLLEAHFRAHAAIALERIGSEAAAAEQWARAFALSPLHSVDDYRKWERDLCSKPECIGMEAAWLDSATRAEFLDRTQPLRSEPVED